MRSSEFFAEAASMTVDAVKALAECFAEAASMTVDAVKALAECFARAFLQAAKAIRKLAKRLDPRWQRRYRYALARSRRNNLYLKSIGRCR